MAAVAARTTPTEVRSERLRHAVPQPGADGPRDRHGRLPVQRPHPAGLRHRRRAGARVPRRRRAVQGARAPHRRGHRHHAALLDRGRGHVRGRRSGSSIGSPCCRAPSSSRWSCGSAATASRPCGGPAGSATAGSPRSSPRSSSASASRRRRPSPPRPGARCRPITSACSSTAASTPTRPSPARWRAPFIPRGRIDDAALARCTAFGPAEVVRERLEEYIAGGGSKFIVRPMCPPERMLDQLGQLASDVIPDVHRR